MIKYGLFLVFTGIIIYEGVYAHPTSRRNDTRLGSIYKNPKNIARRSIYYEDYEKKPGHKTDSSKENSLESIVVAIDTGVKKIMASKDKPDIVDNLVKTLVDFAKKRANDPVYLRSKAQEYDIQPELVRYKEDKPSVLLEINSDSIVNGLKELLRSKTVNKLMERVSKEAAVVYRSIKNELEKEKNNRDENSSK